jgi:hypothetical protein
VLLVGLLVTTFGITTAVACKNTKVVTGKLYPTDLASSMITGKSIGTVTFNTQTGAWTTKQDHRPLPPTDAGIYYLEITTSKPVKGVIGGVIIIAAPIPVNAHGTINQSGTTITGNLDAVNAALANGGVFVLQPNSV